MKNALISPVEPVQAGYRVAQVSDTTFEMAPPYFWVECPDDMVADTHWYNPEDGTFVVVPPPALIPPL